MNFAAMTAWILQQCQSWNSGQIVLPSLFSPPGIAASTLVNGVLSELGGYTNQTLPENDLTEIIEDANTVISYLVGSGNPLAALPSVDDLLNTIQTSGLPAMSLHPIATTQKLLILAELYVSDAENKSYIQAYGATVDTGTQWFLTTLQAALTAEFQQFQGVGPLSINPNGPAPPGQGPFPCIASYNDNGLVVQKVGYSAQVLPGIPEPPPYLLSSGAGTYCSEGPDVDGMRQQRLANIKSVSGSLFTTYCPPFISGANPLRNAWLNTNVVAALVASYQPPPIVTDQLNNQHT